MLFPCLPVFRNKCRELEKNKDIKYTRQVKGSYNTVYFDEKHSIVSRVVDFSNSNNNKDNNEDNNNTLIFSSIKDWFCNQRILENLELFTSNSKPHYFFAIGFSRDYQTTIKKNPNKYMYFFSDEILEPMNSIEELYSFRPEYTEFKIRFMEKFLPKFVTILQVLHKQLRLVHNDIKHNNILIRWKNKELYDFDIVLIDFGLSFVSVKNIQYPSYIRASKYIAPLEIVNREFHKVIDETIDVYALGVLTMNQFTNFSMYEKIENKGKTSYAEFLENFFFLDMPTSLEKITTFQKLLNHVPFQNLVKIAMHSSPRVRLQVTSISSSLSENNIENNIEKNTEKSLFTEKSVYTGPWWNFVQYTMEIWQVLIPTIFIDYKIYVHPLVPWLAIYMFAQLEEHPYGIRDIESCFYIALAIYNNDLRILDLSDKTFNTRNISEIMIMMNRMMYVISTLEHSNPIKKLIECEYWNVYSKSTSKSENVDNFSLDYNFLFDKAFLVICFLYQAFPIELNETCFLFNFLIKDKDKDKDKDRDKDKDKDSKRWRLSDFPSEWKELLNLEEFQDQVGKLVNIHNSSKKLQDLYLF